MNCEICGTPFRRMESSLVCANGHTLQNTLEVADDEDTPFYGRHRIIRRPKKAAAEDKDSMDPSVAYFVIFRTLFNEAKEDFGFQTDDFYKYFTGFYRVVGGTERRGGGEEDGDADSPANPFVPCPDDDPQPPEAGAAEAPEEGRQADAGGPALPGDAPPKRAPKEKIEGDETFSAYHLPTLIYLSKRHEMERGGQPYFFDDFKVDMRRFKRTRRLDSISRRYKLSAQAHFHVIQSFGRTRAVVIANRLRTLADFDSFCSSKIELTDAHSTGVISRFTEYLKHNVRQKFPRDIGLYRKYFDEICRALRVSDALAGWDTGCQTGGCNVARVGRGGMDELLFYWKKFVYVFNYDRAFIPELQFTLFIAQYFISKGVFEGSILEGAVLDYLQCTRTSLSKMLERLCNALNSCTCPEEFLSFRDYEYAQRYRNLRKAVWIIDAFKKSLADLGDNLADADGPTDAGDSLADADAPANAGGDLANAGDSLANAGDEETQGPV